jgi:hypothetical protein
MVGNQVHRKSRNFQSIVASWFETPLRGSSP